MKKKKGFHCPHCGKKIDTVKMGEAKKAAARKFMTKMEAKGWGRIPFAVAHVRTAGLPIETGPVIEKREWDDKEIIRQRSYTSGPVVEFLQQYASPYASLYSSGPTLKTLREFAQQSGLLPTKKARRLSSPQTPR